MPETKVCAVCGKSEDAVIEEGFAAEQHDPEGHEDCWLCAHPLGVHTSDVGCVPVGEERCPCWLDSSGRAATSAYVCTGKDTIEGVTEYYKVDPAGYRQPASPPPCACGFPVQVVLDPEALADSPVCVHQAQALDFLRRWTDPADGTTTDDLLEALVAKVDSLSALLTETLRPRAYLMPPDKPVPATGGNPYGPWRPWYPSTAKPFGWPEPATISSSTPRT